MATRICSRAGVNPRSNKDLCDRLPVIHIEALLPRNIQPPGIEAEQVQHGSVNVGDIVPVLDRMKAQFIGRAVNDAALYSGSGHPRRETIGMMVTASRSPSTPGVRPNSVPHTTIVSSRRPRCFRSFSRPAIG